MTSKPRISAAEGKTGATEQILDRLAAVTAARNDSALARELGVSRQTLSSWRKRSTTPFELIASFAAKRGLSLDYILLGKGSPLWAGGEVDPLLAEAIGNEFGAVVEGAKGRDLELFPSWSLLGYRLALIYNRVIKRVKPGEPAGDVITEEVRFLRDVAIQESVFGTPPRKVHPEELAHWKKLGISPSEILGAGTKWEVARVKRRAGNVSGPGTVAPPRGRASASRSRRKK